MMLSVRERLERWLPYERSRGWLGDAARGIIPKLEAEIARDSDGSRDSGRDRADGLNTKCDSADRKASPTPSGSTDNERTR